MFLLINQHDDDDDLMKWSNERLMISMHNAHVQRTHVHVLP